MIPNLSLHRLNSITKYPSILTYHGMGERGRLVDDIQVGFRDGDGHLDVILTEKIDGTNARIIAMKGDYFLGSREQLLHAKGDRVWSQAEGIVDALLPLAERTIEDNPEAEGVCVLYCEVFGGKVGRGAGEYSGHGAVGVRLLDVKYLPDESFEKLKDLPHDEATGLRERDLDGGRWESELGLHGIAKILDVQLAPRIGFGKMPHGDVAGIFDWLKGVIPTRSAVCLDAEGSGRAEGIVVRTHDRKRIAKLRVEDYARQFRKR